jgi:hypothetical protein
VKAAIAAIGGLVSGALGGGGVWLATQAMAPKAPAAPAPAYQALDELERIDIKGLRIPVADNDDAIVATALVDIVLLAPKDAKAAIDDGLPFFRHAATLGAWATPVKSDSKASHVDLGEAKAVILKAARATYGPRVRDVLIVNAAMQ